ADVGRGHARSVHGLVVPIQGAGIDAFAGCYKIGLGSSVASWTATRKVRDAIVVRHHTVCRSNCYDAIGIPWIGDTDVSVIAQRPPLRTCQLIESAIAGCGYHYDTIVDDALAFFANGCAPASEIGNVVRYR